MRSTNSKKKTKREKVESWLIRYHKIFSILGLERKLEFPKGTIHKFLCYNRKLSAARIDKIDTLIQEMLYEYEENVFKEDED